MRGSQRRTAITLILFLAWWKMILQVKAHVAEDNTLLRKGYGGRMLHGRLFQAHKWVMSFQESWQNWAYPLAAQMTAPAFCSSCRYSDTLRNLEASPQYTFKKIYLHFFVSFKFSPVSAWSKFLLTLMSTEQPSSNTVTGMHHLFLGTLSSNCQEAKATLLTKQLKWLGWLMGAMPPGKR